MGRRPSSQESKKAAKAKAAAEKKAAAAEEVETDQAPETIREPIGEPPQEIEDPTQKAAAAVPDGLPDLDSEEAEAVEEAPKGIFAGPPTPAVPTPNKPSFDWRIEKGKKVPNLIEGEDIVGEFERDGIPYVRTSRTRFIYLVTAPEYEKAFGLLSARQIFVEAFPNAFPKKAKGKKA